MRIRLFAGGIGLQSAIKLLPIFGIEIGLLCASSSALSSVHCFRLFDPVAFALPKSARGLCASTSIVRTMAGSTCPVSRNRDKW